MSQILAAGPQTRPLSQRPHTFSCVRPAVRARSLQVVASNSRPAADPSRTKIRVKLKAYELNKLDQAVFEIMSCAEEAEISGPVPLPRRIKKFTVLRSPHVNKDSREQFEIRTHSRLVDVYDPPPGIIDNLMKLELPAGVDVNVKLM